MKTAIALLGILIGCTFAGFSQQPTESNMEMHPQITGVFPSSDSLPENLLRMYIHFSRHMKPIGNLEKIHFLSEYGQEVSGAIFNNVFELWNHDQTQLTIILDPSRVKTGLRSNELRGRAFVNSKSYQLFIEGLEDVDGNVISTFTKSFVVSEEDLNPPNIDLWEYYLPKSASKDPLIIRFPEMLDRLSLIQRLKLTDSLDRPVRGLVKIGHNESEWLFYPDQNWVVAEFKLYVHSRLEDPSGNNINGLFDHQSGSLKNDREGVIETITLKITK